VVVVVELVVELVVVAEPHDHLELFDEFDVLVLLLKKK
jgi:hypothetical protein